MTDASDTINLVYYTKHREIFTVNDSSEMKYHHNVRIIQIIKNERESSPVIRILSTTCATHMTQESQVTLWTLVGIMALLATFVTCYFLQRFLWASLRRRSVVHMMMRRVRVILNLLPDLSLSYVGRHFVTIDRLVTTFAAKVTRDHHLLAFLWLHILHRWQFESWTVKKAVIQC